MRNLRTGPAFSKREPPVQNGRVGTYANDDCKKLPATLQEMIYRLYTRGIFKPRQKSMMKFFCQNSQRLKAINNFRKNIPS